MLPEEPCDGFRDPLLVEGERRRDLTASIHSSIQTKSVIFSIQIPSYLVEGNADFDTIKNKLIKKFRKFKSRNADFDTIKTK